MIDQLVDEVMYVYLDIQCVGILNLEMWLYVIQFGDEYVEIFGLQFCCGVVFFGDLWM